MRKMCVVPKAVIDDWLLNQDCECSLGAKQLLELACHITSLHELRGYPAGALVARLLPNGDVRVKTPEESMEWHPGEPEGEVEVEPEVSVEPAPHSDTRFWVLCGFLAGIIVTEMVWIIRENWEVWF